MKTESGFAILGILILSAVLGYVSIIAADRTIKAMERKPDPQFREFRLEPERRRI